VQHSDFEKAKGGFSAIAKTIVRRFLDEDLPVGFPVTLPGGLTLLRCQCTWMLSDLDSVRAVLNLKGSAAMRCCHFCRNCVKKNAGVEEYDNYFLDIASSDISRFDIQTDDDIFQLWDHLVLEKRRLRKAAFQKKELAAGLNVHESTYLSDTLVRECITPWAFLLDSMHLYWSNGIVSWEVNAAHDLWSKTNLGNLNDFLSLNWKTQQVESNTARWRVNLAHKTMFEGIAYKGSSSNLQCFWPLFVYFLEQCLRGQLTEELKSLQALRRITLELRKITRERNPNVQVLERLQVEHHELCRKAFGYDFMKPKHHARHHLPKQIMLLGFAIDAFACERKHKFYKSHIGLHRFDPVAQNQNGQFSHMVLKQVMIHHLESVQKCTFHDKLSGPAVLDASFDAKLNMEGCTTSKALQFQGKTMSAGDVLLGDHPGLVLAAIQCGELFFLHMKISEMESVEEFSSTWKISNKEKILPVQLAGRSPMWWLECDVSTLLCLH
jgi:hypothetical protein